MLTLHKKWKSIIVAICGVTLVAGAVAGCSTPFSSSSSSKLTIWYGTDDPVEQVWAHTLIKRFNASHSNVSASLKVYGLDDFNTDMLLALSAGDPPDLAYAVPRTCGIPVYVQHDKLVNLTSYAQKYGWASKLRPGLLQDYNSPFSIYSAVVNHQPTTGAQPKNVPVYSVPDAMAVVGVMYNTRLLHQLGLSIPTSVAQFAHDVVLAKQSNLVPLGLGNADGWLGDDWYQTLANTRFSYASLERELRVSPNFNFQRSQFVQMSRMLDGWTSDFTPNFAGLDAQDGVVSFFHGKTLFQLISSSENAQVLSLARQTHVPIGLFAFPGWTSSAARVMPQSGYEGWVIPKAGHNTAAGVEFINWLLEPSTQRFLLSQGALPSEQVSASSAPNTFLRSYLQALATSRPGVFLDAAPMPSLNATMEANVAFLLAGAEPATDLPEALQIDYRSHGTVHGKIPQIDCEF